MKRSYALLSPLSLMVAIVMTGCLLPLFSMGQASVKDNETRKPSTEQYRPDYHFTPEKTWTNDPNGLIYLDGTFHLYFQNNPFDNVWGHMSWGHATSKDLIHWKHLPVAIPEVVHKDTTISIFSGSAVMDSHNTSAFGKNGHAPIVAIFTGDLPKQKKEAQYIAYSNDQGKTFTMYPGNPVIDLDRHDFRDPNVFWYEPAREWVMAVSLVSEHRVRLYGSKDLKSWTVLSDFGPAGYTGHNWECPSLFSLPIEGHPSESKWVLLVSCQGEKGSYMQYFVGNFDGKTFHNENKNDKVLTVDEGDCFYAAIPWQLSQNRPILMGWLVPGKVPTNPWRGQMSIPRDLSLRNTDEGLRLIQKPTAIIRNRLNKLSMGNHKELHNISLENKTLNLRDKGKGNQNSYWLEATFDLKDATKVGFNIAQDSIQGNKVVVGYDAQKHTLSVDFSATKTKYKSAENTVLSMPLSSIGGKVKIQLLFDNASLEIFGNDGQKVLTTMLYPDSDEKGVSIFSEGKSLLTGLSMWNLSKAGSH